MSLPGADTVVAFSSDNGGTHAIVAIPPATLAHLSADRGERWQERLVQQIAAPCRCRARTLPGSCEGGGARG